MKQLGGFFAITYISEDVFSEALDTMWRIRWKDASGKFDWKIPTVFATLEMNGAISLDKPIIEFHETDKVIVKLSCIGRFDLTFMGHSAGVVYIRVSTKVSAPIRVEQKQPYLAADVDISGFSLDESAIELAWLSQPGSTNIEEIILSESGRGALADEIRKRLERFMSFQIPSNEIWSAEIAAMTGVPGTVIITPFVKIGGVRVLHRWLAIALDATGAVKSHGDLSAVAKPPDPPPPGPAPIPLPKIGKERLRLVMDPQMVTEYLRKNAQMALTIARATRPSFHPNTDDISIKLDADSIILDNTGRVNLPDPLPGNVNFKARIFIRPCISQGSHPTAFASVVPHITMLPGTLKEYFVLLIGTVAEFYGIEVFEKLRRSSRSQMASPFRAQESVSNLPGFDDLTVSIFGHQFYARPDLVGIYGDVGIFSRKPEVPTKIEPTIKSRLHIRDRFLTISLNLHKNPLLLSDPTYLLRYEVRRGSNGEIVKYGSTWSGESEILEDPIDMWDESYLLESSYKVQISVQRPPGNEVSHGSTIIKIEDKFDRSKPYVRWRKHIFMQEKGEDRPSPRISAVHRTDVRRRCKFCDDGPNSRNIYEFDSLDEIPAPYRAGFSNRLCPYCFPNWHE